MSALKVNDGWQAVPRSINAFLANINIKNTKPFEASQVQIPTSESCQKTLEYVKRKLSTPTFNHSMRVFHYGMILLENHHPYGLQPTQELVESFFLSCMLHDIGTVPETIASTRMSFELWGAMHAHSILPTLGATADQAELVAEVINRHQDLGEIGMAPAVLGLIYFATIFDNVGLNPEFIDKSTIESITTKWPRLKWTSCFASTIREETGAKPWSHTTVIDRFAENVEANELMRPYD